MIMALNNEANLTIFLNSKTAYSLLQKIKLSPKQDFPQAHLRNETSLPPTLSSILLSRYEFDSFLKPALLKEKGLNIDFPSFVRNLLKRDGAKKRFFLRSSFLETAERKDLIFLSKLFEELGFKVKFQIIVENFFDLLFKDFSSSSYQVPTRFELNTLELFFNSLFKNRIKNFIEGCRLLNQVFDRENISFLYHENFFIKSEYKKSFDYFCESIGIEKIKNEKLSYEINPLFLDYLKCKFVENNINIFEEISSIKNISNKFKLKSQLCASDLSESSFSELDALSKSFLKLLLPNEKPFEKQLVIDSETCALKKIFFYVVQKKI